MKKEEDKMENKLFTPDFNTKKYTITLEVYENCNTFLITNANGYVPNYHELIGLMEVNKYRLVAEQREINGKAYAKKIKAEKKKSK